MGKGNGTTRASASNSPKGLATTQAVGGVTIDRALEIADRGSFKADSEAGEWTLDTGMGRAEIIKAVDDYGDTYYDILLYDRDGTLNTSYEESESSLKAAKQKAREDLYYFIDREYS